MGFQELSYKGLTRAVFCVAKAHDAKDAAKQRLSALYFFILRHLRHFCAYLTSTSVLTYMCMHKVLNTLFKCSVYVYCWHSYFEPFRLVLVCIFTSCSLRDLRVTLLVVIKSQNSLRWQIVSLIEIIKTENSSSSTSGLRLDVASAPVVFWRTSTSTTVQAHKEWAPTPPPSPRRVVTCIWQNSHSS